MQKNWENIWENTIKFENRNRIIVNSYITISFHFHQHTCTVFINKNTWIEKVYSLSFCRTLSWKTFGWKPEFSSDHKRSLTSNTPKLSPLCNFLFIFIEWAAPIAFVAFFSLLPIWWHERHLKKRQYKQLNCLLNFMLRICTDPAKSP